MNEMKDCVILDITKYNELIDRDKDVTLENINLKNRMKVFEDYFLKNIFEGEEYHLKNIEEYNLDDYHVRSIITKFYEYGNFEINYIIEKIKEAITKLEATNEN